MPKIKPKLPIKNAFSAKNFSDNSQEVNPNSSLEKLKEKLNFSQVNDKQTEQVKVDEVQTRANSTDQGDLTKENQHLSSGQAKFQKMEELNPAIETENNQNKQVSTNENQQVQTQTDKNSETQIQVLKENQDLKNQVLRLLADMQNLRKQLEIDIQRANKNGRKKILEIVLGFLNTLYLAFKFSPQTEDPKVQKFIETLKFSFQQVLTDLKNYDIVVLIPEIGSNFDPNYMTAVNSLQTDEQESIRIEQVVSLGYLMDGQLVKPASVILK